MPLPDRIQSDVDAALVSSSLARLETKMDGVETKVDTVHRILQGEPEFKRPGLVETVDEHDKLVKLIKGRIGLMIFFVYVGWEVTKAVWLHV